MPISASLVTRRVYAAEYDTFGTVYDNRPKMSKAEVLLYVAKVAGAEDFPLGPTSVLVKFPSRGKKAYCHYGRGYPCISFPPNLRRADIVLHELAHVCCPPRTGHGPRFVAALLDLVERWLGPMKAYDLSTAFQIHKAA